MKRIRLFVLILLLGWISLIIAGFVLPGSYAGMIIAAGIIWGIFTFFVFTILMIGVATGRIFGLNN